MSFIKPGIFCPSLFVDIRIRLSDYAIFELSVLFTCFIYVLGQLVGKPSKVIGKEKIFHNKKKVNLQFSRKLIILIHGFPKAARNLLTAKPNFAP